MILFIPTTGKCDGVGHIIRSIRAVNALGSRGSILLPMEMLHSIGRIEKVPSDRVVHPENLSRMFQYKDYHREVECIVLDQRRTAREFLQRLPADVPVVGIDEGGSARKVFEYLIDILPTVERVDPANYSSIDLLELEPANATVMIPPRRVLISFGGEDPAGLSLQVALSVLKELKRRYQTDEVCDADDEESTVETESFELVVQMGPRVAAVGPPGEVELLPEEIVVRKGAVRLKDEIPDYDLVCTSFGITAYEAAAAGIPVIIVSPTRYHDRLARKAGFSRAGVGRVKGKSLRKALGNLEKVHSDTMNAAPQHAQSLGAYVSELRFSGPNICPACGYGRNPSIDRLPDRTFFECLRCGLVYQITVKARPTSYGPEYFFEEYADQYGRTYLEDFEHIKKVSEKRLAELSRIVGKEIVGSLLDVGCAFGPFLFTCAESGIECSGLDVSEEAVTYVRDTLGLDARCGRFEDFETSGNFDALTMWYVLEHFQDVGSVLGRANRLLKPGGIFAFSTPNLRGISGIVDSKDFLSNSPLDHYTIWSPKTTRKILRRFGFKVVHMVVTGHHPERWPIIGKSPLVTDGVGAGLVRGLSHMLRLGDTFEAYAVKEREVNECMEGMHGGR